MVNQGYNTTWDMTLRIKYWKTKKQELFGERSSVKDKIFIIKGRVIELWSAIPNFVF